MKIDSASAAGQSNVPVTFGQVFAAGDVKSTDGLVGKLEDGTSVPLQVDVKARHDDGSVRHAVISAIVPQLAAGQTRILALVKSGAPAQATAATAAELLNAGFTANVSVVLNGQTYTASADALLKSGKCSTWLSGPVVNEWIVTAPLTTSAGVAHPHLTARFAIRSYSGRNQARVDVMLENDWAFEPSPSNFTYDVAINVGGQPVYSKQALTQYHHTRWRKLFWWGVTPQANLRHNTAYLIASKAVPNYDQGVTMSGSTIAAYKSKMTGAAIEPMGTGVATAYMPQTGGRPDIGLLPGWSVMYLLSMDKDAKQVMLTTGDMAGSWSAHYRDKNTGRPVSLADYPYMTILGHQSDTLNPVTKKYEAFPACGGTCTNTNTFDAAHQPSMAYLPYLVTGDQYYLEELEFWAMWDLFSSNPEYREYAKGLVHSNQVRAQAWSLRSLAEAAYITPDADPLKSQFASFLSNNLDWYNTAYSNNASANALGVLSESNAFVYNNGLGLAPWQDDFFTSAVGRTAELGYAKAKPILAWKAKFPIGRMMDPGYCWISASIYTLNVRDTSTGPVYGSFGQAYKASNTATVNATACNSTQMAMALGLRGVGEMVGYAAENTGYPSNMQPALAYGANSSATGGMDAWRRFAARPIKPDYSTGPQFDIIPR